MTMKLGETGKRIVVATGFDMSSNTSLQMRFKSPTGVSSTVTASLGGTSLSVTYEDGSTATLTANEWMYWDVDNTTTIDIAGTWQVEGIYNNTGATPDDIHIGGTATFTVLENLA